MPTATEELIMSGTRPVAAAPVYGSFEEQIMAETQPVEETARKEPAPPEEFVYQETGTVVPEGSVAPEYEGIGLGTSAGGAFVRNVLPAEAAVAAGTATAGALAPLGAVSYGVIPVVGGLVSGLAAGMGARKLQDEAAKKFLSEENILHPERARKEREAHPWVSTGAEVVAGGLPSAANVARTGKLVAGLATKPGRAAVKSGFDALKGGKEGMEKFLMDATISAEEAAMRRAAVSGIHSTIQTGVGAGTGAAVALAQGRSPGEVLTEAALGGVFTGRTPGQVLTGRGRQPNFDQSASESEAAPNGVMSAAGAEPTQPVTRVTSPDAEGGSSPPAGALAEAGGGKPEAGGLGREAGGLEAAATDVQESSALQPYPPPSLHGQPLTPLPGAPTATGPIKGVREMIRDLATGLKIPMRFGRLTSTQAGGYFKRVQNLIGSAKANDLPVIAHEVGHKIDTVLGLRQIPAIRTELMHLGDNARAGSRSSWTPTKGTDYRLGEGVAEFMRYWIVDPPEAARLAPRLSAHFQQVLAGHPDLATLLEQSRANVQLWRSAPPEARLDSSISIGGNPNKTRYTLPQLTRDLVDDLHILRMASDDAQKLRGRTLKPMENPYLLARLLRGSFGMAETFIRRGVVDYNTKDVRLGTSLEDALRPVSGRLSEFRRYLVARRAKELHAQGRETGLVVSDVDFVVNKYAGDAAFQQAAAAVKQWQDALLQYTVDAGYVSAESAAAMRAMNADYVPFHRVFEIGAGEDPAQAAGGMGRGLNTGTAGSMRRLYGSSRDIVDPLETMLRNAYVLITAAEKTAVARAIAGLADSPGMAKWVEEVRAPMEQGKVSLAKIREQLEAAGADVKALPDDLLMTFWNQSGRTPMGENMIKVMTAGGPKFYRLNKDLYETFAALNVEDAKHIWRMVAVPAQFLRAGVTLDPAFSLANLMRDAVGGAVINKYGMLPFEASIKGMAALLKNPRLVAEWAAAGGENAIEPAFFDKHKTADYLRNRIAKDLTPAERAMIVVKSPLRALRYIAETTEKATRIGEYQKALDANLKAGMSTGDARRMAAYESRDRQDFSKGGARTKTLRLIAAFWNAGLQGNVKLYQSFKERPVRSTLQGLAFVTIPTLLTMGLNWDDKDYWDRPQWERDAFWLLPTGKDANGHTRFIRLPKPFLPGVMFGTLPERFMQWAKRNQVEEVGSMVKNMALEVAPLPQAATMVMEDFMSGPQGWDTFRWRPIVPDAIADLPPEMQWTEQTTLTARKIGAALGFPPAKVDHMLMRSMGGLGKQAVRNVADVIISAKTGEPRPTTLVNPAGRFIATPAGMMSQAVDTFYKDLERLRRAKAGATHGGKPISAIDLDKLKSMERASRTMSELRKRARKETDETVKQRYYLQMRVLAELHTR